MAERQTNKSRQYKKDKDYIQTNVHYQQVKVSPAIALDLNNLKEDP